MRQFSTSIAIALALTSGMIRSAAARMEVEAYAGVPFGVGRVTIDRREIPRAFDPSLLTLRERGGRAYYPAFRVGKLGPILGDLLGLGNGAPDSLTVTFLFRGEEPLRLEIFTPERIELEVRPQLAPPRGAERLLERWWKDYHDDLREQRAAGDFPPWIHTYLTSMLGARLRLEPPGADRGAANPPSVSQEILELLGGSERLRAEVLSETMSGRGDFGAPADLPLPPEYAWPQLEPPFDPNAEIEPLAGYVPRECFYVRFGKFSNFVWLTNLLEEYGGEMSRLITLRGVRQIGGDRIEDQLGLEKDKLADLFGDTIIADVAFIGRDTFLGDGAAIGLLFQAKNTDYLGNDFTSKRKAIAARIKEKGGTLETIRIADREATFLSTPDNRIRSFYVSDGDYHLVTTSRAIAERFLACRAARETLAETAEFRHARTTLPVSREDTIFAYFSTHFLRGLVAPHYQTELRRRLQSVTDLELMQLARLAARGEGAPSDTTGDLISAGFLPPGFGRRPDGSGPIVDDREPLDSLRGARGSFLPIPDTAIRGVTAAEEARCRAQASFYSVHWKQLDPLFLGLRRFKKNDTGLERLVIDAHVSPLEETKYGWLTGMLGPPVRNRITPVPGDVIHAQAFLKGGLFDQTVAPHHMFIGVQDHVPLEAIQPKNLFQTLQLLKTTPGYLGAWPMTGFLDRLPLGLGGGRPDPAGYSQLLFGLWRRQGAGFSVLSFDSQLLAHATGHMAVEEANDEAQIRLRIDDLSKSRLAGLVNAMNHERARQASVGNARLLNAFSQQLRLPIPQAKQEAERLLAAELVCTLGGDYRPAVYDSGLEAWASTAWKPGADQAVPADYQAPLLNWFRGADAGLTKFADRLMLHAEIDMQRAKSETPSIELPLFNLNIFGSKKDDAKPDAVPKKPPEKLFPESLPPPQAKETKPGKEF